MCDDLFNVLLKTIKDNLTPAIKEIFKSHPGQNVNSIDITKLAESIIPSDDKAPTDFVFKHEKNFVKKVHQNQKKISHLQNEIQLLTNKLNVAMRKMENNNKEITSLRKELTLTQIENDAKFLKVENKLQTVLENPTQHGNLENYRKKDQQEQNDIDILEQKIMLSTCSDKHEMMALIKKVEGETKKLSDRLEASAENVLEKQDALEQYMRRNSLILRGVRFYRGENINNIVLNILRNMGINITQKDIDRTHRIFIKHGKGRRNDPPLIIVKLISHDMKQCIFNKRDFLRQMPGFRGIYIDENLTSIRRNLYRRTREAFPSFDCWTNDGSIYLSRTDFNYGKTFKVTCHRDFHELLNFVY